ncbi:MAG: hypothetical protein QOF58_4740 [Pseudonocardiales bacterium]|jgi:hypothetical protein|nr:hypothetical protein [Pseudonocardiales bacterium]
MLQHLWGWLLAALILAVASVVINIVLHLLKIGNLQTVLFLRKLLTLLRGIPDDVLLSCRGKDVTALVFDTTNNREKTVPLYAGVLTWKGSPRLVSRVRRGARRQLGVRAAFFGLLFVPLFAGGVYLGLVVDWKLLLVPAVLVFHQFVPFYIFDHPMLSGLVKD